MKKLLFLIVLFSVQLSAQITGKVTDREGNALPYVNIYIENSYKGTTTNDDGYYILDYKEKESQNIIFQFLGYKTITKTIQPEHFPFTLNVSMEEESTQLNEVVIDHKEDPAYRIIREAIAHRKKNSAKIESYTADFYSRGLWKVADVPEKIMGQEIGDLDGAIDSTRAGIIYLSETISKIAYEKPDKFTEKITASKVSGNDNGFSFNSAQSANLSFYENTIELNAPLVSPIAGNALSYYRYRLEGVFYENNKLINKIEVIPRRPKDRVWSGTIYIVEDDWQIFGTELSTTGDAIQIPFVEDLTITQNYKYDEEFDFWVKISQTIDFSFGLFGIKGDGRFIAVYSNYDFHPKFEKRTFTNEVLSFLDDANKKDTVFWNKIRPVPLTEEEFKDYVKKDSIQTLRKSKKYLDSIDAKSNKFGIMDPLTGYSYSNSYDQWSVRYSGPLPGILFNTVQGWNSKAGLNYQKWYDENRTNIFRANVEATYGLADDRVRFSGSILRNFNWKNKKQFWIQGGSVVSQFNASEPISPFINSISTLFFERNYMKVYEMNYARIGFSQELFNGLHLYVNSGYEFRKPLFNHTDYVLIKNKNTEYTSNNPLLPDDFNHPAVERNQIIKTRLRARINFAQKYFSNPDMKFNIGNDRYPALNLLIENGYGITGRSQDYTRFELQVDQSVSMKSKGELQYNLKGGAFLSGRGISFADYKHFNGNQTRIGTSSNYMNVFNLMPYYHFSTNKSYFEGHLEHDFKGWILGKIPGINQLNFNLIAGAHFLSIENQKPYAEFSIGIDNLGFGKFRVLRLDYVRSYHDSGTMGAFIFGLKFLNLINP